MTVYLTDVTELNLMLEAVTEQCIFLVNGVCWTGCKARDYCQPGILGLADVDDVKRYK